MQTTPGALMSTITVRHDRADRFDIAVRGHELSVDQPIEDGGHDWGPTPTELFVASLAACTAHYAHRFLQRHRLDEDVTVEADWTLARSPARVGDIELTVTTCTIPTELEARFERTIAHCTVHNSLDSPPGVTIRRQLRSALKAS